MDFSYIPISLHSRFASVESKKLDSSVFFEFKAENKDKPKDWKQQSPFTRNF